MKESIVNELKPCPFCGSDDVSIEVFWAYAVYCGNCGIRGPIVGSEVEAIETWNDRKDNGKEEKSS